MESKRDENPVKRRRIHLNSNDCEQLSQSPEGAQALTQPHLVPKSSKDPHRGLYPRHSQGFTSAAKLYQSQGRIPRPCSAQEEQQDFPSSAVNTLPASFSSNATKPPWSPSRRRKKFPPHSNTLDSYFHIQPKPPASSDRKHTIVKPIVDCKLESSIQLASSNLGASSSHQSTQRCDTPLKSCVDKTTSKPSSISQPSSHSKTYGLLGDVELVDLAASDDDEEDTNYFECLPDEVLQNILCQLPLQDLCLNVSRICRRWNGIITDDSFIPWKKRYLRLLKGDPAVVAEMKALAQSHGMSNPLQFLGGLCRYMMHLKRVTAPDMLHALQKHSQWSWAETLAREKLKDIYKDVTPNPWSMIAVLVLLAEKVSQVSEVIQCLFGGHSRCSVHEIVECMYCIATFLLLFKTIESCGPWNGMHYRVYYALYLFENESLSTCDQLKAAHNHNKGQQSLDKYAAGNSAVRLTHEQLRICNYNITDGEVLKIIAFAGTGKTTTLIRYTQLRPGLKFLLTVYNKSIAVHSKSRFPINVECRTGHSLAFQRIGRRYGVAKKLYNLKLMDIVKNIQARSGISLYVQAKFVKSTLETFMASADESISTEHVPNHIVEEDGGRHTMTSQQKTALMHDAQDIWKRMIDLEDKSLPITHDGYLKLYQLLKPRREFEKYDVLLIDEAQDMTPALSDILLSQKHAKILVGDPHQQIYTFRGAVNAMQQVEASKIFYLTQSFRFGPEIAWVAATCLDILKKEKKKVLVGNALPGSLHGEALGQLAVICRSNFTVFSEAVKACCFSDENKRVAFAGGTDSFGFDTILDIYVLFQNLTPEEKEIKIQNRLIRGFVRQGFGELVKFAKKTSDRELWSKLRIVEVFNNALPGHIQKIKSKCVGDPDLADIVFSTAHKAKGLEFSTVKVTDDFSIFLFPMQEFRADSVPEDELNLLYVAVTRAKKRLILSSSLLHLLTLAGDGLFRPVLSQDLKNRGVSFIDVETLERFSPSCFTLHREAIFMSDGRTIESRVIAPHDLRQKYKGWLELLSH